MANQLNRREAAAFLKRHGFRERKASSGHRYFVHEGSGVKVVVPGHGPLTLTKKVTGHIVQSLERAGFDKDWVKQELWG